MSFPQGPAIALIMIMIIVNLLLKTLISLLKILISLLKTLIIKPRWIVIMIISPGASSRPAGAISLENKNAQQRFQEQVIIILIMKRTYRNENHHV